MQEPKIGLALGGGGALGTAHVGVLRSLTAHSIPVSAIAGTSAGAIIGAFHAFGISDETTVTHLSRISWRTVAHFSFSKFGLLSNEPLGAILHNAFDDARIEDSHIPFAITATDIATGELVVFKSGPLIPALLATSCIPGIFTPVTIDGRMLVDGGLMNNLPITVLPSLGADVLIGVNVIPRFPDNPPTNWFDVVNRAYDIATRERYGDTEHANVVIHPDMSAFSYSSLNHLPQMVAEGTRATDEHIEHIRTEIIKCRAHHHATATKHEHLTHHKPTFVDKVKKFFSL